MEQGHRFLARHFSVYNMLLINCNITHRSYILKGRHIGTGRQKMEMEQKTWQI